MSDTVTIGGLPVAPSANLTGAAKIEVEDSTATSGETTLATLRTKMFAGGTGYTASDPLTVGAVTASGLIDLSGASAGQIKFPSVQDASANANTLDDYAEGTWTGALVCGTSGTITLSSATGSYTKVGRAVTITGQFSVSAVSSPVGQLSLTGLPFAPAAGASNRLSVSVWAAALQASATSPIIGSIQGTATVFIDKLVAGAQTNMAADVMAGSTLFIAATYFAA